MKILILVLSCKSDPYDKLMAAQQKTWDSISVPGVKTVYYYGEGGGFKEITDYSMEFGADTGDDLPSAQWKLKMTLDKVMNDDWDFIFRTNSSSYIDKKRLIEFAETLPKTKCYCGIDGCGFASGAGFFISRDCAQILASQIQPEMPADLIEDVYLGTILSKNGICVTPGAKRLAYPADRLTKGYHYRCKGPTGDRNTDIEAFNWLFENN